LESDKLETVWVEVVMNKKKPLLICTIYCPPSSTGEFLDEFSGIMDCTSSESRELLVMGDFNVNYLAESSVSRRLRSVCSDFNLQQLIIEPTRVTENSETLIDLILTTSSSMFTVSGCLDAGVSNHFLVYTVMEGIPCYSHKIRKVSLFGKCDVDVLLDDLLSAPWDSKYAESDIDNQWEHWKKVLFQVLNKHAPCVNCRVRRETLPWSDSDIRKLMRLEILKKLFA
jgi:hypothetical protein